MKRSENGQATPADDRARGVHGSGTPADGSAPDDGSEERTVRYRTDSPPASASLTPAQFRQAMEAYDRIDEASLPERDRLLEQLRTDSPVVHREVVRLRGVQEEAVERFDHRVDDLRRPLNELSGAGGSATAEVDSDPQRIGGYTVLRTLGVGGMGEVYLARREGTDLPPVAIKVVRSTARSRVTLDRFRSEQKALSVLEHPGIARVLDAGQTEHGAPYFVMEYVPGEPVTAYCDRLELGVARRLDLLVQICDAVQHAHQKGIVHRDLKPSNLLVVERGGVATPKVIDFGIAKSVRPTWDGSEDRTRVGEVIGTLEYMSPEQASLGTIDIDTRSDVYALGLLAYRLLVGCLPSETDHESVGGQSLDQVLAAIREREVGAMSTAVVNRGQDELPRTGRSRSSLARRLRGDLDWIAQRALAPRREERYVSAAALADDLRRHLADQPVMAGPPSLRYQVSKLFRRHRAAVLMGSVAACGVVVALLGTTYGLIRSQRAERRALEEAATTQRVSDFLVDLFATVNPESLGVDNPAERTALDLLDTGVDRLRTDLDADPEVRTRLQLTISDAYRAMASYPQALELARQATDLQRELHGESSAGHLRALLRQQQVLEAQGDYAAAQELSDRAVSLVDQLEEPGSVRVRALRAAGTLAMRRGRYAESLRLLSAARSELEVFDELGAGVRDVKSRLRASVYNDLAIAHWYNGEIEESLELYPKVLDALVEEHGRRHGLVAAALNNYGLALDRQQRHEEAEAAQREALAIRRELYEGDHPVIAESLNNLAVTLGTQGRSAEAVPLLEEALEIRRQRYGDQHEFVATTQFNLGNQLPGDQRERRRRLYLEASANFDGHLGANHPHGAYPLRALGELELAAGRPAEAAEHLSDARRRLVAAFGEEADLVLQIDPLLEEARTAAASSITSGADALSAQR